MAAGARARIAVFDPARLHPHNAGRQVDHAPHDGCQSRGRIVQRDGFVVFEQAAAGRAAGAKADLAVGRAPPVLYTPPQPSGGIGVAAAGPAVVKTRASARIALSFRNRELWA